MYAKLFASLYQGTLRGCADELLVFTNLLAHADMHGNIDKHWRAIAEETGIPEIRVREAIKNLEAPDPESRSPEMDGRRIIPIDDHRAWGWQIVNYGKYREIKNEEDRRESNRLAQERYRARQKAKAEAQENQQDSEIVSNSKQGVSTSKHSKPIQKQKQIQKQIQKKEEPAIAGTGGRKNKQTPLPEDWEPDADLLKWAKEKGYSDGLEDHTLDFKDYYIGHGKTMVHWPRTWQRWIRNANGKYADKRSPSNQYQQKYQGEPDYMAREHKPKPPEYTDMTGSFTEGGTIEQYEAAKTNWLKEFPDTMREIEDYELSFDFRQRFSQTVTADA